MFEFSIEEGNKDSKFKRCQSLRFLQELQVFVESMRGHRLFVARRGFTKLHVAYPPHREPLRISLELSETSWTMQERNFFCGKQANVLGVMFLEQEQGMQRRRQLKV